MGKTIKNIVCAACDHKCPLIAEIENGTIVKLRGNPDSKAVCSKPYSWKEYIGHKDRLLHPLKRVGERGGDNWEAISWNQALDEIAEKMKEAIHKYGPETIAVSSVTNNTGADQGMIRRFMNLIGTPNFITGLHMCYGNTCQVHRVTYGYCAASDYSKANCILLLGHNPHKNNWVREGMAIDEALRRGAKLIVLDPRKSENAKKAHIHLPLRYGTDAAMLLGFIHVIIEEELYDKEFVRKYTYGFDRLKERAAEYDLFRVSEITGCRPEDIAAAARLYATSGGSVIPWGPIPDMQVNGTSAIRCEDILMSICGFLGKTELIQYPHPDLIPVSELELHEYLSPEQQNKQLGTETYPLFTYKGYEPFMEPTRNVYGEEYLNLWSSFMGNPSETFRAMQTEKPYPVKVFLNLGTNSLLGFTNQQRCFEGLMNQDLVVVFDHWMTPTAQLADYVLPGDYFLERPELLNQDNMSGALTGQAVFEAPGECKNLYYILKGLADRLGIGEYFPWKNIEELYDYRLSRSGRTWDQVKDQVDLPPSEAIDTFGPENGFATPTGKIELYSTAFKEFGYDPLPYFKEPVQTPKSAPELASEYPYTVFVGLRDRFNYLTNMRQIESLRRHEYYPEVFIHPVDAGFENMSDGQWVWIETTHGRMLSMVKIDREQPIRTLRIAHGWWLPELKGGLKTGLSAAMYLNDALIIPDEEWNTDREQGIVNLRGGLLAKIYKEENPEIYLEGKAVFKANAKNYQKKNVLVITGSPINNGNSTALAAAFSGGAACAGHEIQVFNAAACDMDGCHGDRSCIERGYCGLKDDGMKLAEFLAWADIMVIASPSYWNSFPAKLKAVLDRFFCYVSPKGREKLHVQECYLLASGMLEDVSAFTGMVEEYLHFCTMLGLKNAGTLLAYGLNGPEEIKEHPKYIRSAVQMGMKC